MSVRKSVGGPYPPNWKEIATAAKDRVRWICVRCGHAHDPKAGYSLTVHHLDMNPANCLWWNLAALCQRCHLHIQHKVVMERPYMFEHTAWFKPYVAGYYAHQQGEAESVPVVMAHMERLLAYGQVSP